MTIDHPQIPTLEYNYITNGIYIGTNQCCQTHFDEKLKKEGIEADISLEEEKIDAPFGIQILYLDSNQNPYCSDLRATQLWRGDDKKVSRNEEKDVRSLSKRTWTSANYDSRLFNKGR